MRRLHLSTISEVKVRFLSFSSCPEMQGSRNRLFLQMISSPRKVVRSRVLEEAQCKRFLRIMELIASLLRKAAGQAVEALKICGLTWIS